MVQITVLKSRRSSQGICLIPACLPVVHVTELKQDVTTWNERTNERPNEHTRKFQLFSTTWFSMDSFFAVENSFSIILHAAAVRKQGARSLQFSWSSTTMNSHAKLSRGSCLDSS